MTVPNELEHNLVQELDAETRVWLDADLGENLPEYDWGTGEIPAVKPIRYQPGVGFIVGGKNDRLANSRINK